VRISDDSLFQAYLTNLRHARAEVERASRQLVDGKRVRVASDAPFAAAEALELRARVVRLEGYERSAGLVRGDLRTIEEALGGVFDLLSRAQVLASGASSPVGNPEVTANEIDGLRAQLVDLSNTAQRGRYLFAGTETLTRPFDDQGVYAGNLVEVQAPVDGNLTVGATLSGQEVFKDGGDLFQLLTDLSAAVRAGDTAAIEALGPDLEAAMTHVSAVRSEVGVREARIDDALARQADEKLLAIERISAIEDVDLTEAVLELTTADTHLQTQLASAGRVLGRSLFDYLR
jgi:flagellar hook-associated protein 3 FlgL